MSEEGKFLWWQKEIVYQIYPRSFQDSNGDGVGDLPGITQRLDYLKELGIGAIWISPIFPSPMADFGYDVSDYTGIHPLFGNMDDFDKMIEEIHKRGMKLLLDFVPNHTSEEHPWFLESKQSKDNPKRDWYLWHDPAPDGGPPNNWQSVFGGSGWEYDEGTDQYYYHAFLKEQPDLNWRNPDVQEAMFNAMRFWLDKGVDGFRVDVMWHMVKDARFRDNPPNPDFNEKMSPYRKVLPVYSTDQPEVHEIVEKMRDVMNEYDERVMIGEIYLPIRELMTYYGKDNSGAHLPFNFLLIEKPWDAREIEAAVNEYEGALPEGGWPNWVLGNHDKSRIATRAGKEQAKVAGMLLLTLRGTPTMYYGDEIGMEDVEISPDQVQDPQEKNIPGKGLGRDPERTPMQWNATEKAGFTTGEPWLPLMEDHEKVNVEKLKDQEGSILMFYKKLIDLRQKEPALHVGAFTPIFTRGNLLSYIRSDSKKRFLVGLNLGSSKEVLETNLKGLQGEIVLSTHDEEVGKEVSEKINLQENQGILVELK